MITMATKAQQTGKKTKIEQEDAALALQASGAALSAFGGVLGGGGGSSSGQPQRIDLTPFVIGGGLLLGGVVLYAVTR